MCYFTGSFIGNLACVSLAVRFGAIHGLLGRFLWGGSFVTVSTSSCRFTLVNHREDNMRSICTVLYVEKSQ